MTNKTDIMRDLSDVQVTFMDGEVKVYRITAGTSIGGYLAKEAGNTGILILFNDTESYAMPLSNVRDWVIRPLTKAQYDAEQAGRK